jgi:PAS domain S-box-containing protein
MQAPINYQRLIEAVGDAIIVANPQGFITVWNPAAERLFGFARDEAVGQKLDLIIPEHFRERHWAGYGKTMATGETKYVHDLLKVPALHKNGRTLSIAFTVALLRDSTNGISGIVAVIRDETARFQEERALRRRLAELEAAQPQPTT